jgi:K+:H+ antiporter
MHLLFLQMALLLLAARLGSEATKRMGLPAVVGELAAGVLLGPTLFGHYWPDAFHTIFPAQPETFALLDVVGTLGMVLLLLLTGLETDLRLLKNLGRSALIASATGMVLPFALGLLLGLMLPAQYLAQNGDRTIFALFVATAMSISAMPVIAKILMDLDLTRRNIGLVILSAGVVDDTAGWIILSLIAGAASRGGFHMGQIGVLARTVGLTVAFVAAAGFVLYPLLRALVRLSGERFRTRDTDLVVLIVVTFLCAAATDAIGIHAVFGAFVAGTVFRQVPRLKPETVQRLETFVFAILAPIFFGIVGLKVDLWKLGGGGVLGIALAVACVGKLVGCTAGAMWGRLRFWEAASIAVAMNARGAMELVVATVGLNLGILNQTMFSVIVMVAVVTSFMAPLGLRLTMRMVRITDEERRRMEADSAKGVFDPERVRILVPTAGGPNAFGAARLGFAMARKSDSPVEILFVEAEKSSWDRMRGWFKKSPVGQGIDQHLAALKGLANGARPPQLRRASARSVADAIIEEARKEFDLVLMGASRHATSFGGDVLAEVVAAAPCHVAVMRAADPSASFRHLLVPIDGTAVSRLAAEFAVRYAELADADLTLAVLTEHRPQAVAYADVTAQFATVVSPDEELKRLSPIFATVAKKPQILHFDYDPSHSALAGAVARGGYDLVVIGAENRAVQNRLFFGYDAQRLLERSPVAVVVVVPNIGKLK